MISASHDGSPKGPGMHPDTEPDAMARARAETLALYDTLKASGPTDDFLEKLVQIEHQVQPSIAESPVSGAALLTLLGVMPFWTTDIRVGRSATYTALLQYGGALTDDGEWEAASEVFTLVARDAERDYDIKMAARCLCRAGQAYRMCADWDSSDACCTRAISLAGKVGDIFTEFRCQLNQASRLRDRGDLLGAEHQLLAVISSAKDLCPEVVIIATGALATVAQAAGRPERAIELLRQTVELAKDDQQTRTKALVDIANCLTDYGLPAVAKEALQIVLATAPGRYVRNIALLNLFPLATNAGDAAGLDSLRARIRNTKLTPKQQTQFALYNAQGLRNLGQIDLAREELSRAHQLAKQHKFFQLAFEAEAETRQLRDCAIAASTDPTTTHGEQGRLISPEIRRVIDAVHSLSAAVSVESSYPGHVTAET